MSSNLRPPPAFLTPEVVRRMLEQIDKPQIVDAAGTPVVRMPQPKPSLRLVGPSEPTAAAGAAPARPRGRWAGHVALHNQAEFRELAAIAHQRGIALHDLAIAMEMPKPTVASACRLLGLRFDLRPPLADPLTKQQLRALADPATPLPELRRDRLRQERLERRAAAERQRRATATATTNPREATHRPVCRPGVDAPSPEPAPVSASRPATPPLTAAADGAGSPLPEWETIERANARRRAAVRRRIEKEAAAILDGDEGARSSGGRINSVLAAAVKTLAGRRAEEERLTNPVEQAKLALQRRGRVVHSMAVWDGPKHLYFVGGLGKNVTAEQLLAEAERLSA